MTQPYEDIDELLARIDRPSSPETDNGYKASINEHQRHSFRYLSQETNNQPDQQDIQTLPSPYNPITDDEASNEIDLSNPSTPFIDAAVYDCGSYRHQTSPIKTILHANAFEGHHGPLWAITAQFSNEVEQLLRNSNDAPTTFLMKRFHSVFGGSIPRLGILERPGKKEDGCLHIHLLLAREQFPDTKALRKQLFRVFGRRGNPSQIEIKPTSPEVPYETKGPFGMIIGGAAGFLLYAAKDSIGTRSWLNLKRRRYHGVARPSLHGRVSNKRLKRCLNKYDITSNAAAFYFDDLMFRSQELGRQAKALWDAVRPEFLDAYETEQEEEALVS